MNQPAFDFDHPATAEAIASAGKHADDRWWHEALDGVRQVAIQRSQFTADDVCAWLERRGVSTHDLRALGAVMRGAASAGWCHTTDNFVRSKRASRHNAPIRVWQSDLKGTDE